MITFESVKTAAWKAKVGESEGQSHHKEKADQETDVGPGTLAKIRMSNGVKDLIFWVTRRNRA